MRRVVITGLGAITPFGDGVQSLINGLEAGRSAVRTMQGWGQYKGLYSRVGAPAELKNEKNIPRKNRRTMGRLSLFAVQAAEQAVKDARMDEALLTSERVGCAISSTMGGAEAMTNAFELMLPERDLANLSPMSFFQCVSHTAVMNVAQYFGLTGCVMAPSAACASGLQSVGLGYELIQLGKQDLFLCGGAEELHPIVTGIFDILFAASTKYNDEPHRTPRPFDEKRDGLVCGEGSGVLVLEEYEHALKRNAKIYGEVIGYSTRSSGEHVSESKRDGMVACLKSALRDAGIAAGDVDYVNAHATATVQGDQAEAEAIREIFGDRVPVSSLKGYIGHTLGASGAIELIASLAMMEKSIVYPTLNLETVDKNCEGIWHVQKTLSRNIDVMVKNSFAFGGINASLICRKWNKT